MTPSTTAPDPVVTCDAVTRTYDRDGSGRLSRLFGRSSRDGATTVNAIDHVSLAVRPGEFVGIAGPSGSGKSTLIHLLAVLDTPTHGTVRFLGTDTNTLSPGKRTALRLRHVGIVFQRFHLLPSLSARGNVALPLVERGVSRRKRRARATELLERVGLGDRITHAPGELSGGEQQRVAIARALSTDPTLVIADEPTGELDTETGASILEQLSAVAKQDNRAVVMATHDRRALAQTDRVIRLIDGKRVDDTSSTDAGQP